jgi:hypothetical protein
MGERGVRLEVPSREPDEFKVPSGRGGAEACAAFINGNAAGRMLGEKAAVVTRATASDPWEVPGPECSCGAGLRRVPLPAGLAGVFGEDAVWVHVGTGGTRCYPESSSPEDAAVTAEPIDD